MFPVRYGNGTESRGTWIRLGVKKRESVCDGTPGRRTSWTLILGYWLLKLVMKVNFVGRVEVSR